MHSSLAFSDESSCLERQHSDGQNSVRVSSVDNAVLTEVSVLTDVSLLTKVSALSEWSVSESSAGSSRNWTMRLGRLLVSGKVLLKVLCINWSASSPTGSVLEGTAVDLGGRSSTSECQRIKRIVRRSIRMSTDIESRRYHIDFIQKGFWVRPSRISMSTTAQR